jgi:hypothetical protein
MKITEKDIEQFKALNGSGTQKWLVDYVERLVNEVYDVRNISVADLEARKEFAQLLKTEFIDRLNLTTKWSERNLDEFV